MFLIFVKKNIYKESFINIVHFVIVCDMTILLASPL